MSIFLRILYEFFDTRNLYEVLCVDKNEADVKKAIEKAYKRMALKFHPDKNSSYSAEEKFKLSCSHVQLKQLVTIMCRNDDLSWLFTTRNIQS